MNHYDLLESFKIFESDVQAVVACSKMRFACHVANLLGTMILVVSGLVGNTPGTSNLARNSFEIEQDIWPVDGSNPGIDKDFNQEQYLTPAPQLETTT